MAKRSIWYQDETKDWITITDDDDLQLAYETAILHFSGHLKVFVKPIDKNEGQSILTYAANFMNDKMNSSLMNESDKA